MGVLLVMQPQSSVSRWQGRSTAGPSHYRSQDHLEQAQQTDLCGGQMRGAAHEQEQAEAQLRHAHPRQQPEITSRRGD